MGYIDRSALLPYTPEEMFRLVRDVDSYKKFLPWCTGSEVLAEDEDGTTARINFAVGNVSKSFTTRNANREYEEIAMRLVEGPFSELQGSWRFQPLGKEGCKITLRLEYDFSSQMLSMVVGPVFNKIANSLVDSFHKRAIQVYGRR